MAQPDPHTPSHSGQQGHKLQFDPSSPSRSGTPSNLPSHLIRDPAMYGSVSGSNTPGRRSVRSGRSVSRKVVTYEGHATVKSSVINLANTVIGAGALAFPSAFASMGLVPGILSCVYSATTTAFGLYLLSRCATEVGKKPGDEGRKASFNEVARLTFGKGWAIRLFDVSHVLQYSKTRCIRC